jgi:lipoprotein-anchoring transpeptidase ErfK/SrfK
MKRTITPIVRRTFVAASILLLPLAAEAADVVQTEQVQRMQILTEAVQTAQVQPGLEPSATFLDPGKFVWRSDPSASGPIRIVVSLPLQIAYVFKGSTLIATSSVSTGMPGHDTPTGTFPILAKEIDHKSNIYDDAPMPFMQRLTWDGVALHAGKVTGQPASHGCVRLPPGFAKKLFAETSLGAQVVVTDDAPLSAEDALALAGVAPIGQLASR